MSETANISNNLKEPVFKGEVLLCEDNETLRCVVCEYLAQAGVKTEVAENGKEGYLKVKKRISEGQKMYDLVLMDIFMPIMDGIEATSEINALNTGVSIIAMTSNVTDGERALYIQSGMADCLVKPFTSSELRDCLMKHLAPAAQPGEAQAGVLGADKQLTDNLIRNFVKNNRDKFAEITGALELNDIKLAHRLAHTLKGNAAQLGKTSLQKAAQEVESNLKDGANNTTAMHIKALETELSAVLSELEPIAAATAAIEEPKQEQGAEDFPGDNSVLIVDDDSSNLMQLTNILCDEYTILTAKDGARAIQTAKKFLPDLILLDIIMPGMDGFEVLAELKKDDATKDIPVIFISGLSEADGESEIEGLALGAVDYIRKPFKDMVVKQRVRHNIQIVNLQRQLQTAVYTAQKASQAKSSFLAGMSHEIRTPMNAIIGLTELLLEGDFTNEELFETIVKINTAGATLMELISDVLDISKIEAGKFTLTPVRYELASLLRSVIAINVIRIGEKPINFRFETDGEMYRELFGDDLRIKQILNNLISNAIKFTKEGTITVSVSCRRMEDDVELRVSVSDTGIGIHKDDLERIFENFSQVNLQENRNIEGTGLGLGLARRFAELMDGRITAESEPGKGSRFDVSLRQGFVSAELMDGQTVEGLCSLRYEDTSGVMRKLERPDLSYAAVLVVDDSQTNLDVAAKLLRKYKMRVNCCDSGFEAIEKIKSGEPFYSAVFMDHMMPEMDGIEATRRIRALGTGYAETVPIIALTANALAGNDKIFMERGFQAYLPKPVSIRQMDAVVREWIAGKNKPAGQTTGQTDDEPPAQANTPAAVKIPGVDAEFALSLYDGDMEMFTDILETFAEGIPAELEKLRPVSESNLSLYAGNVHTIKGTAASIGANVLSERAKTLETMAKAGDIEGVLAENEDFIKQTQILIDDINMWLSKKE